MNIESGTGSCPSKSGPVESAALGTELPLGDGPR